MCTTLHSNWDSRYETKSLTRKLVCFKCHTVLIYNINSFDMTHCSFRLRKISNETFCVEAHWIWYSKLVYLKNEIMFLSQIMEGSTGNFKNVPKKSTSLGRIMGPNNGLLAVQGAPGANLNPCSLPAQSSQTLCQYSTRQLSQLPPLSYLIWGGFRLNNYNDWCPIRLLIIL